jgi:hypothetical protein
VRINLEQRYIGSLLAAILLFSTTAIAAPPDGKGKGGGGGNDGGDGSDPVGPSFMIETLNFDGAIYDLNDNGDFLCEIDTGDGSSSFALSTFEDGVRNYTPIVLPAGWTPWELDSLNNSREIVGIAYYDALGDGLDADGDEQLDPGDILKAGIRVVPDIDGDGVWEMDVIFPGPYAGRCDQINNQGDIAGVDDDLVDDSDEENEILLYRPDAPSGAQYVPIGLAVGGYGTDLSDRDANGDVVGVATNSWLLPRKYETRTDEVTILPTFDRTSNNAQAFAFSVNADGFVVGQADNVPAIWLPNGEISRIPGWPKTKNADGRAYGINDRGEICIRSYYLGAMFYSPEAGLIDITANLVNPELIPEGYSLELVRLINEASQMIGSISNGESGFFALIHTMHAEN